MHKFKVFFSILTIECRMWTVWHCIVYQIYYVLIVVSVFELAFSNWEFLRTCSMCLMCYWSLYRSIDLHCKSFFYLIFLDYSNVMLYFNFQGNWKVGRSQIFLTPTDCVCVCSRSKAWNSVVSVCCLLFILFVFYWFVHKSGLFG